MAENVNKIEIKVGEAAEFIASVFGGDFATAIVLGSGLGDFAHLLQNSNSLPYKDIPHFPVSSVSGHAGVLTCGYLGQKKLLVMEGRFHYYEGYQMEEVVFPIRVMKKLGIKNLFLTNAAGGINSQFSAGSLMLIKDHINLMGANPLRGGNLPQWGQRFPDMTEAYSPALRELAQDVAAKEKIALQEGVYVALSGPNYETPAEIRFLELIGGDAVGMSTVPEVLVAKQGDMEVLGISCITNMAAGKNGKALCHEEVLAAGRQIKDDFILLLKGIIEKLEA